MESRPRDWWLGSGCSEKNTSSPLFEITHHRPKERPNSLKIVYPKNGA